jgi:hypothetical protein
METAKCVKENLESEQRTVRMPVGGAVFEFEEIKQIYEDTQKQRGTGRPRAVVLMVQICTAYPQATVNGSGSRSEHLTQPGRVCCNLVPIVRLWAPRLSEFTFKSRIGANPIRLTGLQSLCLPLRGRRIGEHRRQYAPASVKAMGYR